MIPKLIHIIWMQGVATMPTHYLNCCQSWEKHHKGWDVKVWAKETLLTLQNAWVLDIDDPTLQSDVARFEIVKKFGGVYVDCDMLCLKPIDPLIASCDAFISKRSRDMLASSSFGATKEHPWLVDVVDEIGERRDMLTHPGEIRGPLERATRRHPKVKRLANCFLELASEGSDAYAVHPKSGSWRNGFDQLIKNPPKRKHPAVRKPWPRQQDT